MTDKVQKIKAFLIGMAGAACCDAKTKKVIETYILPFIESMQEEPVSEDFEEAANKSMPSKYCWSGDGKTTLYTREQMIDFFKTAAQWQKEQFEKNRSKHCNSITNEQAELEQKFIDQHLDKYNRMPTFLDAIEYGMNLQKEQMIMDAKQSEVVITSGGILLPNLRIEDFDYADKSKVIILNDD